jgi:DNA-binding protein WhiA
VSATAALREELAHVGDVAPSCALAELSGALRFGGSVTVTRAGVGFTVESTSGAVLRRVRQLVGRLGGQRVTARVEVHRPAGLHRSTRYRLVLGGEVTPLLRGLGLLDQAGRPVEGGAATRTRSARDAAAYARGALMAAGSVTDPDGPVHLEVRAPGPASADGRPHL